MSEAGTIRYENTMDDLVAFNEHTLAASPHFRRQKHLSTWILPLAVLLVCVGIDLVNGGVEWTPWGVVFGIIYVPTYRIMYRRSTRRGIHALLGEGRNESLLCEHVLEITPEALVERTSVSESRAAWRTIERVETTPTHAFIYVQAHGAHVVPRHRVEEGDYEAFVAAVKDAVVRP